jgi:phage-related protein
MYNILFYENKNGYSELYNELIELSKKSVNDKNSRIQLKQITLYIELLKNNGTNLSSNITKHLVDDIWELRPGNNRVLYFYLKNNDFILLHMFRKKTNKTPKYEIERAIKERNDYISRNGGKNNENMGRF